MNKNTHGFTLIELIVTVAVFGILIAMIAPSSTVLMRNNRLTTQTDNFISALNIARSEAVKRGAIITLCISNGNATPDCDSTTTAWQNGWIIFTDLDGNASFDNTTENLIRTHDELSGNNTLTSTHFEGVAFNIQFNSNGALRARDTDTATSSQRTFTLCDPYTGNQLRARGINIKKTGNINAAVDTNSPIDNIVNDVTNSNVTCPTPTK